MAIVIPFEDALRSRRRQRWHREREECLRLLALNARCVLDDLEGADEKDRPLLARRLRVLGELLEYAMERR